MRGTEPERTARHQVTSRARLAFLGLMTRSYWKGRRMAMYRSSATANMLRMELWKTIDCFPKTSYKTFSVDSTIRASQVNVPTCVSTISMQSSTRHRGMLWRGRPRSVSTAQGMPTSPTRVSATASDTFTHKQTELRPL